MDETDGFIITRSQKEVRRAFSKPFFNKALRRLYIRCSLIENTIRVE